MLSIGGRGYPVRGMGGGGFGRGISYWNEEEKNPRKKAEARRGLGAVLEMAR